LKKKLTSFAEIGIAKLDVEERFKLKKSKSMIAKTKYE
jgi:hypothetical protein